MLIGITFIGVVKTATEVHRDANHRAIMMRLPPWIVTGVTLFHPAQACFLELPVVYDSLETRGRDTKCRSQSSGPGDSATFGLRNLLLSMWKGGSLNQHNRIHQDDQQLEKSLERWNGTRAAVKGFVGVAGMSTPIN